MIIETESLEFGGSSGIMTEVAGFSHFHRADCCIIFTAESLSAGSTLSLLSFLTQDWLLQYLTFFPIHVFVIRKMEKIK